MSAQQVKKSRSKVQPLIEADGVVRCGATRSDGSRCRLKPVQTARDKGNGRCKFHGGATPGAPKGNKNGANLALYSKHMSAEDRDFLAAAEPGNLHGEIAIVRVQLYRALRAKAVFDECEAKGITPTKSMFTLTSISESRKEGTDRNGDYHELKEDKVMVRPNFVDIIDRFTARLTTLERTQAELEAGVADPNAPMKIEVFGGLPD